MLLEAKNISRSFTRAGRDFPAVKDSSINIDKGDFIHLIGRSGSGKSTFLLMLAGLLNPDGGEIVFDGVKLSGLSDYELSSYRNSKIGYVPQSMGTLPNLTVLDNIRLPYFFMKREGDGMARAKKLLELMGIADLSEDFCKNLSGGELKRVMLARALMNEPQMLIADEPTSDLDKKTSFEIMDLLKEINERDGITMLIVTHEEDLLKYGKSLYQMEDGVLSEVTISRSSGGDSI